MKAKDIGRIGLLFLLIMSTRALADRALDRAEILQILENLTSEPTKTWITSGTITARHEEYRAPKTIDSDVINQRIDEEKQDYLDNPSKPELKEEHQLLRLEAIPFNVRYELSNEYTMVSEVVIRYDANHFYWEIDVESRTDSLSPPFELLDNDYTDEFNRDWNDKRIFAWNGQKYTNYFLPANQATIDPFQGNVNGPLTAGVIPWGHGKYTLEKLSAAQLSAVEVETNGQVEIHLTITRENEEETLLLDPAMGHTLKLYNSMYPNNIESVRRYENHQLVNGKYCPYRITIEKYDNNANPPRLLKIVPHRQKLAWQSDSHKQKPQHLNRVHRLQVNQFDKHQY